MITFRDVQPMYLGKFATYWRVGQSTTVRCSNANGRWCCLTCIKDGCDHVLAVQQYDTMHGHGDEVFLRT